MTQIAFQGGKVVVYGDRVGTGQECCCDGEDSCDLSQLNQTTQPDVSVTTDCQCNNGTLDGTYPLLSAGPTGASWSGTTTCDWTGLPSDAPISVSVGIDCLVTVATYQYPFETLQGVVNAQNLTLDQDGYVIGTAVVPLEDLFGVVQCTATVVFGP